MIACLVALRPAPAGAEVTNQQAADRSVAVTTSVYTAQFDARGNLTELLVKGAKALTHQFGDPGKPPAEPPSINVIGQMVAVRSGTARVEWTFDEETIKFLTEGYNFECTLDSSVKAIVAPQGGGGALGKYNGRCTAVVLANDLTVASKSAMHAQGRRYLSAAYTSGGVKPGTQLENELRLGAPADAAQMLGSVELLPIGANQYFPAFSDPAKIVLKSKQENLSKQEFALNQKLTVMDHYVAGKPVFEQSQPATLAPGQKSEIAWNLPALPPGFYYATLDVCRGEQKMNSAKLTFMVDLPNYTHPLTRPADFAEFWKGQLAALRAIPFDAKLTEVPEKSSDAAVWYDLELTIAGGKRLQTFLQVPRQPGKYTAKFGGGDKATNPTTIFLNMPIKEVGMMTYTQWKSREANNMLESYLFAVRLTDYLRSRPDVSGIYLFGASRTGPVQFVNTALDSSKIIGVDIHVPTSAGIGWTDKPYRAWGVPNQYNPADPKQVAAFTAMAAYFDPVNFAPDMTVPWITAYGLDDTLAQPQGIEVMYALSPAKWKRISRDGGGHQYSPGFQKLQKELAAYLQTAATSGTDEKIMKEH
jgi:cephalosporin-C deacetylase-like acetyl esterase